MKITFFTLAILFSLSFATDFEESKELIIYDTFEDYTNNKGMAYEGDFKVGSFVTRPGISNRALTFRNKDKNTETKRVRTCLNFIN